MSLLTNDPTALIPLAGTIGIAATIVLVSWRASTRIDVTARARTILLIAITAVVAAWAILVSMFGSAGAFGDPQRSTIPPIAFGLIVPMAVVLALFASSPSVRLLLSAIPQRMLIGVQLYRALGGMFLILLAQHRLPAAFALPAGWGDIAIGITAPIFALGFRTESARWRAAALTWNVLGVIDLVIAVGTGVLTSPGLWQRLAFDAPNITITKFPYVLVPTFLVPISLLLHAASLRRLIRARRVPHPAPALPGAA